MKKIICLLIVSIIILSSCQVDTTTDIQSSNVSDELSNIDSSYSSNDLPEFVVAKILYPPPYGYYDDINEIAVIDPGYFNEVLYYEELEGKTISGTYFGYNFENAVYEDSMHYAHTYLILDYYRVKDFGRIGFERGTETPHFMFITDPGTAKRDEPYTEEELLEIAEPWVRENTCKNIDWSTVKLDPEFTHTRGGWHQFCFRQYDENGICINSCEVWIEYSTGSVCRFKDFQDNEIPDLPDYTLDEYLESAKTVVLDYYADKNFEYVKEVIDFSLHGPCYFHYDEKDHIIQVTVWYTVVYADGTENLRKSLLYHYF